VDDRNAVVLEQGVSAYELLEFINRFDCRSVPGKPVMFSVLRSMKEAGGAADMPDIVHM